MTHVYRELVYHIGRMGPQEWFWVMAAMLAVGWVCLRGFGSRSKY